MNPERPNNERTTLDYAGMRRLRFVPRWAVVPHIKPQNVAEHSFHVLWVFAWLHDKHKFTTPSFFDAIRVLAHDVDEATTGDHPSPSKAAPDASKADAFKCWLKIADCLEALVFVREEQTLGNLAVVDVVDDLTRRGQMWVDRLSGFGWVLPSFRAMADELWATTRPDHHPGLRGMGYGY